MADKIIAPIALLLFLVFLAFLAIRINEIDLWVVVALVVAMVVYDFWKTLRHPENGSGTGA